MDRGYYSGHGLTNFEEQRMCKEMVGRCWFLMVVTEECGSFGILGYATYLFGE